MLESLTDILPCAGWCRFFVQVDEHSFVQDGLFVAEIRYPEWQKEFEAAIVETHREKLLGRVMAAEAAIFKRLQDLSQHSDKNSSERQAIEDALASLRSLKKNELGFPDWETK